LDWYYQGEVLEGEVTHIAGTSAGAIVGSLHANGHGWEEILKFFKGTSLFSTTKFAFNKPGIIDSDKFYKDFKKLLPHDSFASLKKPLYVTATDVIEGKLKIFTEGELIKPVLASSSIPGVFTPVEIGGSHFVDGGVLNNFPTEPLLGQCDKLIGVYVNPLKEISHKDLKRSFRVVERALNIRSVSDSKAKFSSCDTFIYPEGLCDYAVFGMRSIDEIFQLGYTAAKKVFEAEK